MKKFLIVSILIAIVLTVSITTVSAQSKYSIPSWIKGVAGYWSEGKITDDDFGEGVSFLIDNEIIKVPKIKELEDENSQLQFENIKLKNDIVKLKTDNSQSNRQQTPKESTKSEQKGGSVSEPVQTEPGLSCSGNAKCITGTVTKIVDGDTLDIDGVRIRISLTNTPEKDHSGFSEATEFTAQLCPVGSTITVDQDDLQPYDKYGRLVGKVFCGEKILNSELLYNHHANILTQYCKTSEFSGELWAKEFGC